MDMKRWNPRGSRKRVLAVMVALACVAIVAIATVVTVATRPRVSGAAGSATGVTGFVTRSGDRLMLNGKVFRFSGANIYWGGLDNAARDALNYPTAFRVNTALQTVVDTGGRVVRCQSCGMSVGNPLSVEPVLNGFNATALKHIDYFVAQAGDHGLRLDIPLIDSYTFFVGGYHVFTDWLGLSTPADCPSAACASQFYTNPNAIKSYERYIYVLLNHVNVYTGVANKDNPAIMSWETGNEMPYGLGGAAEYTRWTATISAYIKSIAPNQLVMDGSRTLDPGDLTLPHVDIEDPHYYPLSTSGLAYEASQTAAAGKALVAGEYGWNDTTNLPSFLSLIANTPSISGDLYWDLVPPNDDFGFVEDWDGYQLHFPGDWADVAVGVLPPVSAAANDAPLVTDLRNHAYAMAGGTVPGYAPAGEPAITSVERVASPTAGTGNLIEWHAAPDAASYVVRRSVAGPTGPWTVAGQVTAASTTRPWLDSAGGAGPNVWYQVTALNPAGIAGQSSAAFQMTDLTLDDNAADFSLTYSHASVVAIDTRTPSLYNGDGARMAFWAAAPSAYVVWQAPGAVQTIEGLAYYSNSTTGWLQFGISANGQDWTDVPAVNMQLDEQTVNNAGSDQISYIYTIDNVQKLLAGARYVSVQRGQDALGTAELGEIRITSAPRG
jgi:mannan endo-1,4-beta-mannosidase